MGTKEGKKTIQAVVEHEGYTRIFTDIEVVHEIHSNEQRIIVGKSPFLGRLLIIDDEIQFTESCYEIYHELFCHPAIMLRRGDNFAIYGGGDGLLASEIVKLGYRPTMVELDPEVIKICRQHFSDLNSLGFDEEKGAKIIIDSALLHKPEKKYDIIFVDLTDHVACPDLYCENALAKYKKDLAPGGLIVFYAEPKIASNGFYNKLRRHFKYNVLYGAYMHFVGSFFTFGIFSDRQISVKKIKESGWVGDYFSGTLFHEIDDRFLSFYKTKVVEEFDVEDKEC
jgi:spermidine synthase